MIAVPARVLPAPRVIYAKNTAANPVNGSWNMKDKKVLDSVSLPTWTILRIGPGAMVDGATLKQNYEFLIANFKSCGLKVGELKGPPGPSIPALNESENEERFILDKPFVDGKLREIFEMCRDREVGMLLVLLSSTTAWIRERVKFWGDIKYGSPSPFVDLVKPIGTDP